MAWNSLIGIFRSFFYDANSGKTETLFKMLLSNNIDWQESNIEASPPLIANLVLKVKIKY